MSHITIAVSKNAFRKLFGVLRDNFTFSDSDSENFGLFSFNYSVACHLEGGSVDLQNDNKVEIKELDIKWDTLKVGIGFNIPIEGICVGGWCLLWAPFVGCVLRQPRKCLIDNPFIDINLDLSGIITSEISVTASLVTKYKMNHPPSMSAVQAQNAGIPNMWQIFIDPVMVDIDPIDIADTIGDLLENAVKNEINYLLGFLPGWAKDVIWERIGPVIDLIKGILDLPDDIGEWFFNLLGDSFYLFKKIETAVLDYFAEQNPIHELEDPYPILPASSGLIPVKIPIKDLEVTVNIKEMILKANVEVS